MADRETIKTKERLSRGAAKGERQIYLAQVHRLCVNGNSASVQKNGGG
jgi:hypothetical protein